MENLEKMRKRQREQDQVDTNEQSKLKARSAVGVEESAAGGAMVPSEEEVEEFFEILRRMNVAIRYFDKKINVEGERDGRFSGKLREALETGRMKLVTAATSEGDHRDGLEEIDDVEGPSTQKNQIFDLNCDPDKEVVELTAANTGA